MTTDPQNLRLPWRIEKIGLAHYIVNCDGRVVAQPNRIEIAPVIISTINSSEQMCEALEGCVRFIADKNWQFEKFGKIEAREVVEKAQAAITKARVVLKEKS